MNSPLDPQRIDQLVADYIDGTIGEADLAAFCAWVEQSPANARLVASYSAIEYGMTEVCRDNVATDLMSTLQEIEAGSGDVGPVDITAQLAERKRNQNLANSARAQAEGSRPSKVLVIPRAVVWSAIAAAVLVVGWVGFALLGSGDPTAPVAGTPAPAAQDGASPSADPPVRVGQIVASLDAAWDRDQPPTAGAAVDNRPFNLTAGIAQIKLTNGVLVTLEAPCTFKPDSPDRVHLTHGKLVGKVPPNAVGFTVHTPTMDIIDLSTEFAIRVDTVEGDDGAASASEVSVLDGKVHVRPAASSGNTFQDEVISAGESRRSEPGSRQLVSLGDAPLSFYRGVPRPYEKQVRDAGPVAYWRFDEGDGTSWTDNLGSSGGGASIHGGEPAVIDGPVGKAVRFDGKSRLELSSPRGLGLMRSYTITSWVYLDAAVTGQMRIVSNARFVGQEPVSGFGFGLRQSADGRSANALFTHYGIAGYTGSDPLPIGQWFHLAVIVDDTGWPTFYLNGKAMAQTQVRMNLIGRDPPGPGNPSNEALLIGQSITNSSDAEAMIGAIDELAIYDRALDPAQLADQARAGAPNGPTTP